MQYRFVRKVLRSSSVDVSMEVDVLGMVATLKSDNIITLMAMYTWGTNIYYVFPYVEGDLDQVLRGGFLSDECSDKSVHLPKHWLWTQLVGVTRALSAIHTDIENPFPHNKGHVIVFHFDLKPKSILVTSDKKLKITDFGQSAIEFVGEGKQLSSSFTMGELKYMAPESWSGGGDIVLSPDAQAEEIMVFLNYDVWSLACIMLEVLIFLLEPSAPRAAKRSLLEDFDVERDAEEPRVTFFNRTGVKRCVRAKVSALLASSVNVDPASESRDDYLRCVFDLLLDMFCFDKDRRPYSKQVFGRLNAAGEKYEKDSRDRGESLRDGVREKVIDPSPGYREIGWWDGGRTRSFLDVYASLSNMDPT
jgi:serine/threonine protein kinase